MGINCKVADLVGGALIRMLCGCSTDDIILVTGKPEGYHVMCCMLGASLGYLRVVNGGH